MHCEKNKERGVPNTGKCSQKILLRIDDIWAKLNGKTEAYGGTFTITRSKAKNHGLVRKCGQIPMTGTQLFRESDYTGKTREPRSEETDKHWRAPASSWTQWHATEAFEVNGHTIQFILQNSHVDSTHSLVPDS